MSSTPECVTETFELDVTRKELAVIFSDAEQRDNSKVSPELGKTAFDVNNLKAYINNNPLKTVREIGGLLQSFRKGKAEESCK